MGQQRHQQGQSGTEVEQEQKRRCVWGGRERWRCGLAAKEQLSLPIYIANMLQSLNARSKQEDSDLALMGYPYAFPSVPKASAYELASCCM